MIGDFPDELQIVISPPGNFKIAEDLSDLAPKSGTILIATYKLVKAERYWTKMESEIVWEEGR